jgi:hypothetical protein
MPSPEHEAYRRSVLKWSREHAHEPDVAAAVERYGDAALVLWHLDLGAARRMLMQGYAVSPRGSEPWNAIIILRCLLLAVLVGQPSLNQWVRDLRGCRVLLLLAGVMMDPHGRPGPGVGTFYDFLHRLHDGPSRRPCPNGVRPSDAERRRARSPKARKQRKHETKAERRRRKKRRQKDPVTADSAVDQSVTAKLVETLKERQTLPNPNDLLMRLGEFLLEVGVKESARRGLLGDPKELLVSGDGSALPTGASRDGRRTCNCPKRGPCECPRRYSDPDADIGYDSHRELYFFGHHLYEFVVSAKGGHDLPLSLRVDGASTSDYVASLTALEHLRKLLRDQSELKLGAVILDAGHDGKEVYKFILHHDMTPIIPLRGEAPAHHPKRPELLLSRRGVPLCPAGVEMIRRGTTGKNGQVFGCPVKAKKLERCPLAPEGAIGYSCRPVQQLGHTVVVQTTDDERLFPPIPRNHPQYRKLMNLRSGSERSFSVKKERFKLLQARHRRGSFWLIRVHLIAVLQHGLAWVADQDAQKLVDHLLGRTLESAAA